MAHWVALFVMTANTIEIEAARPLDTALCAIRRARKLAACSSLARTAPGSRRRSAAGTTDLRRIVEFRVGSHLYGTATPRSDTDIKAVHLPSARDILLQRARPAVTMERGRLPGERNRAEDTDHDSYSLQRFLDLILEGQPIALEMLFAQDEAMTGPPDPLWREVRDLAPRLVSRRATVFLRYARQQAERYGAKGARAAAARQTLALLEAAEAAHGSAARLGTVELELAAFAAGTAHAALVDIQIAEGRWGRHLDLCGRKTPLHASLKAARELAARLLAEYGDRALRAEHDGGVDWKSLSHAVRVGQEAVELLGTGRLAFPLAGARHLLDIKLGRLPYDVVAAEIERLLAAVEEAARASPLPEQPDAAAAESLVLRAYRQQVAEDAS